MVLKRLQQRHLQQQQEMTSDDKSEDVSRTDIPMPVPEAHCEREPPIKTTGSHDSPRETFPNSAKDTSSEAPPTVERDFETLQMRNMRQAEERRKLIEQMMKEDDDL